MKQDWAISGQVAGFFLFRKFANACLAAGDPLQEKTCLLWQIKAFEDGARKAGSGKAGFYRAGQP